MHLEVRCNDSPRPIRLDLKATTRAELPEYFTVMCPYAPKTHRYSRQDVTAVPDIRPTVGLALLGALIGLFGGGAGAAVGAVAGTAAGEYARRQDEEAVRRFNES